MFDRAIKADPRPTPETRAPGRMRDGHRREYDAHNDRESISFPERCGRALADVGLYRCVSFRDLQVRLDAANLPDHLADLTSGLGGLGIVVCVGEVIAQITDLIEAALYCGGRHRAQVLDLRLQRVGT